MSWDSRCQRIAVVIPARNERQSLPRCLSALRKAELELWAEVAVDCWVVLDDCTDGSAEIARAAGVNTVTIKARNVGAARHAGAIAAMDAAGVDRSGLWIASTDADSVVPAHWLRTHLDAAQDGWDALAGTVHVDDWGDHPVGVRHRFEQLYRPTVGHSHAHGANLGVRASAYLRVGGYSPLACSEDVALLAALHRSRARILRTVEAPVTTSARIDAKAPFGFAHLLRTLGEVS